MICLKETKGGVALSQENQSYLRFSVEESLWFRKGQEVEELISISLDPDITIQENDQYVTIRGSLELTGEYNCCKDVEESAEEKGSSQKFVESVSEREEDGTCEFTHRFPVDITIPNNRIQSVYDIDVIVESFDYHLPERSCLKLSAELAITGLYGTEQKQEEELEQLEVLARESKEEEAEEVSYEPAADTAQSTEELPLLFETEARKQQEEKPVTEVFPKLPTFSYQPPDDEEEVKEEAKEEAPQPAWLFQEYQQTETPPSWQIQEYEPPTNPPSWNQPEARENENQFEEEIEEFTEESASQLEVEVEAQEDSVESASSEDSPKQEKKKFGKKKTMTLTEFFARKDEGTSKTRLRVCIVQKGDTVESLAERYEVSTQSLLRVNNLEPTQDVYEGQVLYVPAALTKK